MPSSRDLPDPEVEAASLISPSLADGFFTTSATWEAPYPPLPTTWFIHIITVYIWHSSYRSKEKKCFSSVAQSCLTFCNFWTAERQASLTITNSESLLKLMSIDLVMPSNHVILCHLLLILVICLQSFQASGSFPRVSSSHQVAKVLEFQLQHQSFQWLFKTDFL